MDYALHLCILLALYVGVAQSLNLCVGDAGLMSFAHATLFGVGAYVSALLTKGDHVSMLPALGAACGAGALCGLLLIATLSRLQGDYFAIATFAVQLVAVAACKNADAVTGGSAGIYGISPLSVPGHGLSSKAAVLPLVVALAVVASWLCHWVRNSSFGLSLHVSREDQVLASAFGQRVGWQRCAALALSGGLAALFGALYAHYAGYINPDGFGFGLSLFLLSAVVVGGPGTAWGPVLGVILLLLLPEACRLIPALQAYVAELRNGLSAALLFGFLLYRPAGILRGFSFVTHARE